MTTYTVPRVQGTYADTLMALGLGRLLKTLNSQGEVRLHLAADQDAFMLEISQPAVVEAGAAAQLYDYIKTEKDKTSLASAFDYEREKERRQQFFKAHPAFRGAEIRSRVNIGSSSENPRHRMLCIAWKKAR